MKIPASGPNPLSFFVFAALFLSLSVPGGWSAENPRNGPKGFSPESEAWAAQAVSGRSKPSRRKAGRPGARPARPPEAAVGALVERFTPFSALQAGAAKSRPLVADADNEVWSAQFQDPADAAVHEFAAHLRPDDQRPLYWRATGLPADPAATFEKAAALVTGKVLRRPSAQRQVSGREQLVVGAGARIRNWSGPLALPWERCWFFFVDDEAQKNWEHPCRYVFVAEDLSAFVVQYGRTPATFETLAGGAATEQSLKVVVPYARPAAAPGVGPMSVAPATAEGPGIGPLSVNALDYSGSAANCYAVIISGGIEARQNYIRYWGDSAFIYSTLTKKYGYRSDHIYALVGDGTSAANDRNGNNYDDPVYSNSPTDLDGDGVADIDGSATKANIQAAFTALAGVLTSNDQVLVFVTDHGGQEAGHDAVIWLWGGDTLRDNELLDMTVDLPCPVMFALETCYSGGFVDDLDQANQVIGTACAYDDTSVAGTTWPTYDQWAYYFTAALRGFYPGANPWNDGAACNADSNGDGRVSFKEACDFAYSHRDAGDVPQYNSNPSSLGAALFMDQSQVDLANNSPASYTTIPKDFSFQVMNYDWAIVGVAPSTDHDIRADEDRNFSAPYQSSASGGTVRDFVVYNGHQLAASTKHYAQVYYGSASSYTVEAQWEAADLTYGVSQAGSVAANEVHEMYEVYLSAGQEAVLTLNVTSGTGDLSAFVFKPTRTSGKRTAYDWTVNAAGAGGDESLSFTADTSGYYGVALINENGAAASYTVQVAPPPPLAAPAGVLATDGSYTDRVRVTWSGVTEATHYKVYRNTLNNSATAAALTAWQAGVYYDDLSVGAGQVYYYWVKAAASVDGSRESALSAVNSGYVAPATLASDGQVDTTTEPAYYQFRDANSRWWAAGVRNNGAGENWSLRLYTDSTFTTLITNSAYVVPVDFIVGDGHHAAYQYRGLEAYRFSGVSNASVEFEGGAQSLVIGSNASLAWPAGDVVKMWDAYLTNGSYRLELSVNSGTADLGFALFGSGNGAYFKNRQEYIGSSDKTGNGTGETFSITVTNADYYGLCVWGNDENAANFNLVVTPLQAGLWEGDVSTSWHVAGNWNDNHVPASTTDVLIPAGTRYAPVLTNASGYCRNLVVSEGARLTVGATNLYIASDVHVFGDLNMNNTASRVYVTNDIYWEAGSTLSQIGSARMILYGDWNFESGANVQLTTGYTEFTGIGASWIRSYEPRCNLFNLNCSKTGGGYVGVSAQCVDILNVNNIYNYSGSLIEVYSAYPVVINGFFNNMGGNFRCYRGAVIYDGAAGTVALKPNTGDYFNDLVIRSASALSLDSSYSDTLTVKGSLTIESSSLNANGLNVVVGGTWNNLVGAAGFQAGSGAVAFNRSGSDQMVLGETIFNNVIDARSGGGTLWLEGPITVNSNYTANMVNGAHSNLLVKGVLVASNPACSFGVYPGAQVTVSNLTLGGSLYGLGGTLSASNLVNDGLYGHIIIQDGLFTFRQGTTGTEYVDLNGHLTLSGGRLDIYGGSTASYWPFRTNASLTLSGGVLDFKDQGILIYTNGTLSLDVSVTAGVIRCARGLSVQRADVAFSGGLLELTGGYSGSFYMDPASYCHDVLVSKTAASVTASGDLDVRNDFTIASGVFVAPSNMVVGGDWSNSAGDAGFVEGSNTVMLAGAAAAYIRTDETFYNLVVNKPLGLLSRFYVYELQMQAGSTVHVRHDLSILDGCVEMNDSCTLDIDNNLSITRMAGLNANDRGLAIFVGGNWLNSNTNYGNSWGFDPGYNSTVTFDGAVNGTLLTDAPQERFFNVRVNRPGGSLRPGVPVLMTGSLSIDAGAWSYSVAGLAHQLWGDLTVAAAGSWTDHTAASALWFSGAGAQSLQDLSPGSYFNNVVVYKNPVDPALPVAPLRLFTRAQCLGGGGLTVERGLLDLNSNVFTSSGNVTLNKQGQLEIDAGARLEIGNGASLTVNTGATLTVRGTPAATARVTRYVGNYNFNVENGGLISAEYATFEYMAAGGVHVKDGAWVDPVSAFNYCTFSGGPAGATLLWVDNMQTLTISGAQFPLSPGGATAANVRKEVNQGRLMFAGAYGAFAGESFDYDPFDRVDWHSGRLASVALAGPRVATRNGVHTYLSTVSGDLPVLPLTYYYQVTDQPGQSVTHNNLQDSLNLAWTTRGAKTVTVTASNSLGKVSASLPVSVDDLKISQIVPGRAGGSNWLALTLTGTSTQSVYSVLWHTNAAGTNWIPAAASGLSIPGRDGETTWTDWGATNRNLNTLPNVFYRALLQAP